MKIGSLFTGIGGLDLPVEQYFNAETVWHCENSKFASKLLSHYWPDIPNLGNILHVDFTQVEPIDILIGGFPCQDISAAGFGGGIKKGTRSGRWEHYARAINTLRPRIAILENVSIIVGRKPGLNIILSDLAQIGYDARWGCIKASEVGAPHGRDRWFLVAYPNGTGSQGYRRFEQGTYEWDSAKISLPSMDEQFSRGDVVDWGRWSTRINLWEAITGTPPPIPTDEDGKHLPEFAEWMMGYPIGYTDVGLSRTRRLETIGNSVCPYQAYEAIHLLLK